MKKLLSFLILTVFSFIGFFHNSMMLFADKNKISMLEIANNDCCGGVDGNSDQNQDCNNICCIEQQTDHSINLNNGIKKVVLKIKITNNLLNIFDETLYSFSNKDLIKKTSPPYINREISNYSYHNLVKIIKSNT